MFSTLAERIHHRGEPRPGAYLREAGHTGTAVCEICGTLPADGITEWAHLCRTAIGHVDETGHRVAVDTWAGAIYGPREAAAEVPPSAIREVPGA
jgi:hypothetical protein